jgi:hypothetical protein
MSFSGKQQGIFQPMIAKAWVRHCQQNLDAAAAIAGKNHPAYRDWYEDELEEATGCRSSTECDARRDFNLAMAHFEIAAWAGIYWQGRLHECDAENILWHVNRIAARHTIDEGYLRGWARQMRRKKRRKEHLDEEELPELLDLSKEELALLLIEVKDYAKKHLTDRTKAAVKTGDPF